MSILNVTEMTRSAQHLIGSSAEFTRTFVVRLSGPSTSSAVVAACGCGLGSGHPELFAATCFNLEYEERFEGDDFQAVVVAQYRVPEEEDKDQLPWLRADVWKFQTQGVAVPALFYWDGNTQKPMTNSAGDYIEGVTVDEAQQKITIQSNRLAFPSALAAAVTNCVNDSVYLGFAQDCVKVQGISGELVTEVVNDQEVRYWKITSELLARQTGWNLLIPDVGFNFIEDGQRKRAFVIGPPPDQAELPSANPVPLNGNGAIVPAGQLPAIITRRVYRRIGMSQFFGTPPT